MGGEASSLAHSSEEQLRCGRTNLADVTMQQRSVLRFTRMSSWESKDSRCTVVSLSLSRLAGGKGDELLLLHLGKF